MAEAKRELRNEELEKVRNGKKPFHHSKQQIHQRVLEKESALGAYTYWEHTL